MNLNLTGAEINTLTLVYIQAKEELEIAKRRSRWARLWAWVLRLFGVKRLQTVTLKDHEKCLNWLTEVMSENNLIN